MTDRDPILAHLASSKEDRPVSDHEWQDAAIRAIVDREGRPDEPVTEATPTTVAYRAEREAAAATPSLPPDWCGLIGSFMGVEQYCGEPSASAWHQPGEWFKHEFVPLTLSTSRYAGGGGQPMTDRRDPAAQPREEPATEHVHEWTASTRPGPAPGLPATTCIAPGHIPAEAAAHATERPDHRPITEALAALADAYYAIPAGSPTREQVDERLPALYAAIEAVLSDASRIGGLLAIVGDAEANDLPIHVATGATCAEHDQAATERPDPNDDEHWHRGPSATCRICTFGAATERPRTEPLPTDEQAEAWLRANDLYAVTHIHDASDCDECNAARLSPPAATQEGTGE